MTYAIIASGVATCKKPEFPIAFGASVNADDSI